jgi:crotonobetainyl-CoA hydratase
VFRLVRQLPPKIALELVFTGDPISAADALKWGLINHVVADGEVVSAALALAQRITANAPLSVWASKRVAYGVDDGVIATEDPDWARTTREFTALLESEDAKEGPRAFAEKRQPVWTAR